MAKDYVTIAIGLETRKVLRLIAAQTSEELQAVVARLALQEWQRVQPQAPVVSSHSIRRLS